jgi:lipooligosaccharide transport system permease protein
VVASLVRKVSAVNAVTMTLLVPLMFLGNLWTPIAMLPDWLQLVSKALPSTMAAEIVRVPMLAGASYEPVMPLVVCVLGLLAYLAGGAYISARFFRWS